MTQEFFSPVSAPDAEAAERARALIRRLPIPPGSLGRVGDLGVWLAACQDAVPPRALVDARVVLFAGETSEAADVGAHSPFSGVSEPLSAGAVFDDTVAGTSALCAVANAQGARVFAADISLDRESESPFRVCRGGSAPQLSDGLSDAEVSRALEAGMALANDAADSDVQVLIAADTGVGAEVSAAALIGSVTNAEPVALVGSDMDLGVARWKANVAAVRDVMFRIRGVRGEPVEMLRRAATAEVAAMAGFLAQAAVRRTPVILDGVVVTSAALVAEQLAPGARAWWVAGHEAAHPAHGRALRHLGCEPLLSYGISVGGGIGATAALPVLQSAVALLRDSQRS
ncbi:nicotinate-nucleotide--dimethylbenzimidazole phosphoribosyltransferase [Corynebacterium sp. TAE3-ERU12]|uniref:nicotinate-nucleotide--dimethylbenzimidazole phosphoribosyltransferase n=1 Tax=Corynebacterium sp. TAE3-ERU12 TaxID=2849491 RepID=UPI001C477961|nr:nicotinate-nucleotide--dimethylbenzimidazole phosphoribosyltransferase [Corynebacterium sp. TAE3-ERU12]MBV7296263.1 nicotinate-nucleotide--dimethylbenzimidazole phosphoribosyltransferase [Corynebacterium sp. TAE3-ERU12]